MDETIEFSNLITVVLHGIHCDASSSYLKGIAGKMIRGNRMNNYMLKTVAYNSVTKSIVIVFLCFLCLFGCESPENSVTQDMHSSRLDSLMSSHVETGIIPGAVLQVKKENQTLYSKAFGYAHLYDYNLDSLKNPGIMTTDHLFDLASLTKVLGTTMGMMVLTDNELIHLDDPIYIYLPEFNQSQKSEITIRHLLTHTAGLYEWQPLYYQASGKNERYRVIAEMPLKYDVGKERHYSDLGFMLLGDIIEKVSGQSLDQFLKEQLFDPLNLQHTTFNPPDNKFEKIAATSHGNPFEKRMVYDDEFGYKAFVNPESWDKWRKYTLSGEVNDGNAWYANRGIAGHAGLFSTVHDVQILTDLLINRGLYEDRQLLSKEIIDEFLTIDKFNNGLGWAMDSTIFSAADAPEGSFGHTGFTGTSIVVIPDAKVSVILLTNRQNAGVDESGYYYDMAEVRRGIVEVIVHSLKL